MKKTMIFLFATIFIFSACQKNANSNKKNDGNEITGNIIGDWRITKKLVLSGKNNAELDSKPVKAPENCGAKDTYTFKAGDKFIYDMYYGNEDGKCVPFTKDEGEYKFSRKDKTLSTKLKFGPRIKYKIYKLTNTEMYLTDPLEEGDHNKDGVEDIYVLVFTKVK